MEESFRQYKAAQLKFPLEASDWPAFHDSVLKIVVSNLMAQGLMPYRTQYGLREGGESSPPQPADYGIAAERAFESVRLLGSELFPLIKLAEVRLKGTRDLPHGTHHRSAHYQITGVVDVVSTLNLEELPTRSLLWKYLNADPSIRHIIERRKDEIDRTDGFEIIIDYKGMRRPPNKKNGALFEPWEHYLWQLRTYAWLRQRMPNAKPVVAGVLLYLNELVPSKIDLGHLHIEVTKQVKGGDVYETDKMPSDRDLDAVKRFTGSGKHSGVDLSLDYRLDRSILVLPIDERLMKESALKFDQKAGEIEKCVKREVESGNVVSSWDAIPEEDTCTACDFSTICGDSLITMTRI
jgi:hypothetical protein